MASKVTENPPKTVLVGLSAIRAAFVYAEGNADEKLLIAGHTDSSGSDSYNEKLSLQRGQMVQHIIEGDQDAFVALARAKHVVRDYEQILRWVHEWLKWPCDPGTVDDVHDAQTKEAVKAFQKQYSEADFGEKISVDGIVGKQTWTAFFKLYMRRLAELLETDTAGLADWRTKINWLYGDRKVVGCGEYHPVSDAYRDNHKSESDRRIELLFYAPGEEPAEKPGEVCHTGGVAEANLCPLYNPFFYHYHYLTPQALDIKKVDPHFAPKLESLDISYRVEGLSGDKLTLEVTSDHYKDGIIFTRDLTDDEKTDGNHTIQWDGKTTCTAGELKDLYVNPLYAPYKVRIHNGAKYADTASFKVLYHSLSLEEESWTADGKEPKDKTGLGTVQTQSTWLLLWGCWQ